MNGKSYKFFQTGSLNEKLKNKKKYIRRFATKHFQDNSSITKSFYYQLLKYINSLSKPDEAYYKYTNMSKKKELKSFLINVVENIEDKKQKDQYIVELFGECILPSLEFYGKI